MPRRIALRLALLSGLATFLHGPGPAHAAIDAPLADRPPRPAADSVFEAMRLDTVIDRTAFVTAFERVRREDTAARVLAIADMNRPSTEQRFVIVDLARARVVLQTWVAHGSGSGDVIARRFSNRPDSHQTSLGLYRVGARIRSPKHGPALLLDGLDRGVNDRARAREIIVHAADYVSETFIRRAGRLGRSWGCPAVPRDQISRVIDALADGGYLYVHGA